MKWGRRRREKEKQGGKGEERLWSGGNLHKNVETGVVGKSIRVFPSSVVGGKRERTCDGGGGREGEGILPPPPPKKKTGRKLRPYRKSVKLGWMEKESLAESCPLSVGLVHTCLSETQLLFQILACVSDESASGAVICTYYIVVLHAFLLPPMQ